MSFIKKIILALVPTVFSTVSEVIETKMKSQIVKDVVKEFLPLFEDIVKSLVENKEFKIKQYESIVIEKVKVIVEKHKNKIVK